MTLKFHIKDVSSLNMARNGNEYTYVSKGRHTVQLQNHVLSFWDVYHIFQLLSVSWLYVKFSIKNGNFTWIIISEKYTQHILTAGINIYDTYTMWMQFSIVLCIPVQHAISRLLCWFQGPISHCLRLAVSFCVKSQIVCFVKHLCFVVCYNGILCTYFYCDVCKS